MINEGNSLAELQAKVLRASPHEKKSVSLWTEQLTLSTIDRIKELVMRHQAHWWPIRPHGKSVLSQPMKKYSPQAFALKGSARVTSAGTSPLAGRHASLIVLDDPHLNP